MASWLDQHALKLHIKQLFTAELGKSSDVTCMSVNSKQTADWSWPLIVAIAECVQKFPNANIGTKETTDKGINAYKVNIYSTLQNASKEEVLAFFFQVANLVCLPCKFPAIFHFELVYIG